MKISCHHFVYTRNWFVSICHFSDENHTLKVAKFQAGLVNYLINAGVHAKKKSYLQCFNNIVHLDLNRFTEEASN